MQPEPESAFTCVGGPFCGAPVPRIKTKQWYYLIEDRETGQLHTYERSTPNEPYFIHKATVPTATPQEPRA